MKEFLTSGELMEAVRALDYMAQYKVCEAFYKLSKGFWNGGTGTCSTNNWSQQ